MPIPAIANVIDLLMYHQVGGVTICYRCHARFRGPGTCGRPVSAFGLADGNGTGKSEDPQRTVAGNARLMRARRGPSRRSRMVVAVKSGALACGALRASVGPEFAAKISLFLNTHEVHTTPVDEPSETRSLRRLQGVVLRGPLLQAPGSAAALSARD